MNIRAIQKLRVKLAARQTAYGLWITFDSVSITEMTVALGLDWVVIDAEHGDLDWQEIVDHLRAVVRSDTVALVRITHLDRSLIKRALDLGADGVVIPWVETEEEVRQAVSYARYPPQGTRGIGAERATGWGEFLGESVNEANEHVLVIPILESVKAVPNVAKMSNVEGVEAFFFGPADFSATAGFRGQWEGPGVSEQLQQMKQTIEQAGKTCGVVATSDENVIERTEQGFGMVALGLDSGLLRRSLHRSLTVVGRDRAMRSGFRVEEVL